MCQTYTQTPIYTDTPSRQDHLYLSLVTNKPTITILGEHPVQIKLSQGPAQKICAKNMCRNAKTQEAPGSEFQCAICNKLLKPLAVSTATHKSVPY